jgi:hypothetical protein
MGPSNGELMGSSRVLSEVMSPHQAAEVVGFTPPRAVRLLK